MVSGRGYGHGVGMSQYGAYGMAKAGRTYDEILAHYYTGTTLGPAETKEVRVLLADGRGAVTIASTVPFTIRDAAGKVYKQPAGPLTLRKDLRLASAPAPTATPLPAPKPPLLVRPGKATPLTLDGRAFRGRLEVAVVGEYLRVVNVVDLESYLQGVVAGEVPSNWPRETLRAQAVAARSYALSHLVKGKPFDLYADVRSQVYLGVSGEKPSTTEAVRSTVGEVVLYEGTVASTLYFSSSGGKTANALDVFGVAIPYLVSRPDPWDKASPHHRWGPLLLGARTLQSKFGVDQRVIDANATTTPSGRIRSLVLQTVGGSEAVPASLVRAALGLRSTWITVGVIRLDRPKAGTVVFGSRVPLTGIARGLGAASLSSSSDGTLWSPVGELVTDASGAALLEVKPQRTTRYRIEVVDAASPAQLVRVAPRIELDAPLDATALTGKVRPKLPGTLVTIERKKGAAWAPVGEAIVGADGTFRLEVSVSTGTYRARIAAMDGFTASASPLLQVTG